MTDKVRRRLPPVTEEVFQLERTCQRLSWLLARLIKHQGLTTIELPTEESALVEVNPTALSIQDSADGKFVKIEIVPVLDDSVHQDGPRLHQPN